VASKTVKPTFSSGASSGVLFRQTANGITIEHYSSVNAAASVGTLIGVGSEIKDSDQLEAVIAAIFGNIKNSN